MIFSHSLVILFFPAVVSPPVRERWRSFSPGSCPRSWAVCCSCWHRSRWNLWAGGRRASRHPARPSSRPWSAWCCRPSSNRPAPHRRTAPGCWRWWSFSAGAAARSSTSSWSTAAAGTRCLTEEKQIEAARKQKGSLCVVHVAMWRTCYVDVLRLVLGGEIKSRSRILVVHEAESGRKEHDIYALLQLRNSDKISGQGAFTVILNLRITMALYVCLIPDCVILSTEMSFCEVINEMLQRKQLKEMSNLRELVGQQLKLHS